MSSQTMSKKCKILYRYKLNSTQIIFTLNTTKYIIILLRYSKQQMSPVDHEIKTPCKKTIKISNIYQKPANLIDYLV